MSNFNISDLPFLHDVNQDNSQAFEAIDAGQIKGGQNVIEEFAQKVENRFASLGFPEFAAEAAKGPGRVEARVPVLFDLI